MQTVFKHILISDKDNLTGKLHSYYLHKTEEENHAEPHTVCKPHIGNMLINANQQHNSNISNIYRQQQPEESETSVSVALTIDNNYKGLFSHENLADEINFPAYELNGINEVTEFVDAKHELVNSETTSNHEEGATIPVSNIKSFVTEVNNFFFVETIDVIPLLHIQELFGTTEVIEVSPCIFKIQHPVIKNINSSSIVKHIYTPEFNTANVLINLGLNYFCAVSHEKQKLIKSSSINIENTEFCFWYTHESASNTYCLYSPREGGEFHLFDNTLDLSKELDKYLFNVTISSCRYPLLASNNEKRQNINIDLIYKQFYPENEFTFNRDFIVNTNEFNFVELSLQETVKNIFDLFNKTKKDIFNISNKSCFSPELIHSNEICKSLLLNYKFIAHAFKNNNVSINKNHLRPRIEGKKKVFRLGTQIYNCMISSDDPVNSGIALALSEFANFSWIFENLLYCMTNIDFSYFENMCINKSLCYVDKTSNDLLTQQSNNNCFELMNTNSTRLIGAGGIKTANLKELYEIVCLIIFTNENVIEIHKPTNQKNNFFSVVKGKEFDFIGLEKLICTFCDFRISSKDTSASNMIMNLICASVDLIDIKFLQLTKNITTNNMSLYSDILTEHDKKCIRERNLIQYKLYYAEKGKLTSNIYKIDRSFYKKHILEVLNSINQHFQCVDDE